MEWLDYVSYFAGGAVLTNAIPHFVNGVSGRPFQSPFAKPPGVGMSSSASNVFWGFINTVIGYVLVFRIGDFHLRDSADIIVLGAGVLLAGLLLGHYFGRFHGGTLPKETSKPAT